MKSKKLLVTALAGALVVGSLSVNASSLTKDVTQLGQAMALKEKTSNIAMVSANNFADADLVQGLETMTVNASEFADENTAVIGVALEISDLPQELQDQLTERYEDLAYDMLFVDEEDAESIAEGANSPSVMKATTLALPAQVGENEFEPIELITFSDLSQELQDKLIEGYGDIAIEMQFIDTDDAERVASFDSTGSTAITATAAQPATTLKAAQ